MAESVSGIKHPAFRDALALTRQGGREATGRYLIEDTDQVIQALRSTAIVYAVFASPESVPAVAPLCEARGVPLYALGGGLITKLLGTAYATTTTAVAVVAKRIASVDAILQATPDALLLVAERIQDPRNVGVLIRTAEAAGCAALVLSADSAEAFSRQTVRSTTGSIVRLPLCIEPNLPASLAAQTAKRGLRLVATSAKAPRIAYDADLSIRPLAIVVGNETDGMSDALKIVGHCARSTVPASRRCWFCSRSW
ncbi:MAG: hypothetical protein H7145_02385, partial [Akkermansiaceae bacterium]|nr:hypothetical protein [Armatimonadota bacterium]